jgi:hypothetical protein
VMAYSCLNASCPRVAHMSNPSVLYNGAVTGSSSQNNALSINTAAETVANFRQAGVSTPPGVPTGLRSNVTGNVVTLAWNPVTSDSLKAADAATSYVLQVGTAPLLSNLFAQNIGNLTSVSGAVPAGTYYWRVVAVNSGGEGPPSGEAVFTIGACTAPGAPQNLDFSMAGRVVTLTWAAATGTTPLAYVIEVGSSPGLANLFTGSVGAVTVFTAAAPPGVYFVRVRAQNTCGIGPPSGERTIVVP